MNQLWQLFSRNFQDFQQPFKPSNCSRKAGIFWARRLCHNDSSLIVQTHCSQHHC